MAIRCTLKDLEKPGPFAADTYAFKTDPFVSFAAHLQLPARVPPTL
jgi:hypothetical protein